jgi:hypothetical protein
MIRRVLAALFLLVPAAAAAQPPVQVRGAASTLGVVMPNRDATDLRTRLALELTTDPVPWMRIHLEVEAETLLADRGGRATDAGFRVKDAWLEWRGSAADVRVGYGRLVWGRLDEIMPSDVLNPIDSSRYFLEGRAEARLPIAFARGRVFVAESFSVEGVLSMPGRRGRFDLLEERTSPFNLTRDVFLPAVLPGEIDRREPSFSADALQYGLRVSSTLGRVDVSVSGYRGTESFGVLSFEPTVPQVPSLTIVGSLVERYPRFTMVAADAEAVVGAWAIRAEGAYFPDRVVAGSAGSADGSALDAGVGVDRSVGDYRVFASIVWHRDWSDQLAAASNDDLSLITSVERRFARERYMVRVFAVANPVDRSSFVRALAAWSIRDDLSLDVSAGVLSGREQSNDTLSRFRERDFGFARVRWSF